MDESENIVELAIADYKADKEAWNDVFTQMDADLHFLSDDKYAQWESKDYDARVESKRPVITVDQLSQFVHQVVNDIKMNTPAINVIPDGEEADTETADMLKGLIRNIEYDSNADDAYDMGVNFAVKGSIGFIRVDHDYASDDSFEQKLMIKRVINPKLCFLDKNSIEADGRDSKRATVLEPISVADFRKRWPDKDPACFDDETKSSLKDDDMIMVAEHFRIVEEDQVIKINEAGEKSPWAETDDQDGQPLNYVRKRTVKKRTVQRLWLSGKEVLEETTFPGVYIPLVPVYGEESWIDGKRHLYSLIRKAKDAQRAYNVWKSLETELLMKQPQAPVMVGEGQIEEYMADWLNPSKSMALRYKTHDVDGNALPAPQRLAPPGIPTGIVNAARETVDDIKATMGLYNASVGQRSNETSGKAINARKVEGDVATYHFGDNLVKSITQVGRILVSAIPEIYDTARSIRVIGEEDEPQEIGINGHMVAEQKRPFDFTRGRYGVKVTTGAPFTTKRQEAAQFYSDVVSRNPQLMEVMGDLLFKNMDFAGAPAMAARFEKLIPPKLLSKEQREKLEREGAETVDPEKEQMTQLIQQLQAQLAEAGKAVQDKQADLAVKKEGQDAKSELEMFKAASDHDLEEQRLEQQKVEFEITTALAVQDQKLDAMMQIVSQLGSMFEMQTNEIGENADTADMESPSMLEDQTNVY